MSDLLSLSVLQLLSFFLGIGMEKGENIEFKTEELCRLSSTMNSLGPLDDSYAQRWLEFWRTKGFLP